MNLKSLLLLAAIPLTIALGATDAHATVQTGSLEGTVLGPDGKTALPGVTVTVSGASMIGGARTAKTDEQGHYHMIEIPPGTYMVTFDATGYPQKVEQKVDIILDRTTPLDETLAAAEATGQVIDVTDKRPTIDTTQTQGGEVVSQDFLVKLPVDNDYLNVARMVPGVIGTGNSNVMGAADDENQFLVDGVNITDPVTNTFSANFNFESIQEVEVLTGGFDPEHQALGGVVNVVTKSGGNDFHGGLSYDYHDDIWSPRRKGRCAAYVPNYTPTGDDLADMANCSDIIEYSERGTRDRDYTANVWLGGPILRDKVWFFASYEFVQSLSRSYGVQAPRNYTGDYYQAKLTYQPATRHKLTLSFQTDPTSITRIQQSPYVPLVAEERQNQGGLLISLEHDWFITDKVVLRNQFNYKNQYIDVLPNNGDLNTPAHIGVGGALSEYNGPFYSFNRRDRYTYSPKATYYADNLFGSHEIALGLDASYITEHILYGNPGNAYYYDILKTPYVKASPLDSYYYVQVNGPLDSVTSGLETGVYLQDAWKPSGFGDRLTVRGGLRFDRAGLYNDAKQEVINIAAISPRLYAAYDLTGDGKTVVRGGYGRFIDTGKLDQSDFLDKHGAGAKLFLGNFFPGSVGTDFASDEYFGTSGEATTLKASKITPPSEDAVRLGFERSLVNSIAVGLTWNASWVYHLFEDDDANLIWNGQGTQTVGNRIGVVDNRFRIRTPDSARRYYQDFEFTVRRRFADQFEMLGSYTWSKTQGTTLGSYSESLDIPPQDKYDFGYLPDDHTNVVRLAASYDFTGALDGFTLGTTLNYVSGDRYEHFYYNDFAGGFTNRAAPRLSGGQLDGAPLWDLKVLYGPKLSGLHLFGWNWTNAGKIRATLQVQNVLNNRQIVAFQQGNYDYRDVKYVAVREAPLAVRAGIRYEF